MVSQTTFTKIHNKGFAGGLFPFRSLFITASLLLCTLLWSIAVKAQTPNPGEGVVTLTTDTQIGQTISLGFGAVGVVNVEGIQGTPRADGDEHSYKITANKIVIHGTLTSLSCSNNSITTLELSQCKALKMLYCSSNQLTTLELSQCPALNEVSCTWNKLTALDISNCSKLTSLDCSNNEITQLSTSSCAELAELRCIANKLTQLNLSGCSKLTSLYCSENQLADLKLAGCTALNTIDCNENKLVTLNLSSCPALEALDCSINNLTELKLSGCTALLELDCTLNQLIALDVSDCVALAELKCSKNSLTALDLTKNSNLEMLYCYNNQIGSDAMGALVNSLIDRTTLGTGTLCVASTEDENNECLKAHINIAKKKSWRVVDTNWYDYDGVDANPFAVTLTKEGEGTLAATGADDLNAVAYGTELTIVATPAEGYELTTLTANDTDILATKKVVVKKATEVKATFAKKTFAVTLTKEGEGTLAATGADDLNAVAYGTELTIVATPAEGYELTTLTANDTDIFATQKVVVKEATEVKATFAKKTYAVTLTKEGEGTLTATGANNLNAVPEGTELTVVATPAEGYELTALTANGTDILATKKFVVTKATIVKATFTKKTYAVTLTKEGEGTITATGAADLNAVPEGTELTIVATPAAGYELKALTANSTDILATKKFTVTADTEVKAIFTKKTFAVTLTKEGEGTLAATGADDLNAVAYGTELTIVATPAEGYELTTLTANDTDIFATQKVVVKEATEVKATFAKKTYAVTLTKEGEGTLTATGANNLNAVPEGTELTVVATPAEGYELTALTANGTDILATKKFVVTKATIVKATFTKKTYAVTLTKEGEGTITATGAADLNAVPEGTELTIVATPAAGYELKALTANSTDILATKKFTVTADTEVKAIFTKKTFAVTLTKEGEGTITATGADDLNAVPEGTELTIEATPAAGYELKALTANGTDILATKKVVVKGATEVKATFTKKTYAVTLTKEGEGTITATGADDLNAVPEGTELTIVATPAAGYELKALTANSSDILATRKVVVKGATEVKATFAKKTATDVVESSSVRLYPNPASTYVNMKGAKADALVRLYDANGSLRYEARTDADGSLQINLSAYAEGTYLLRVGDDAQRLLIQR